MELRNKVKIGAQTLLANIAGRRYPSNVMISVTNHCNARCSYCSIPERKQKEMTVEQIFSLIDQITELGCQRISLWGGEPLVRQDIGEIVDYAKGKSVHVNLDSNGYLVPRKIDILRNLDLLLISIDGPPEIHDMNREEGSFEKAIKGIIAARKAGVNLWTITTLTKYNDTKSIDDLIDLAREYDFTMSFQILHHNENMALEKDSMYAQNRHYKVLIRKLIEEKRRGARIVNSERFLKYLLEWDDYTQHLTTEGAKARLRCWAGKLFCNVDTDGTVYHCVMKVGKEKASNFLDLGFKAAFDKLERNECKLCTASGVMEYNFLYSLDAQVIRNWLKRL